MVKEPEIVGDEVRLTIGWKNRYKDDNHMVVEEEVFSNLVSRHAKQNELLMKYVGKGKEIAVEGKVIHFNRESMGIKEYVTEVEIHEFMFLGDKKSN